MFAQTYPNCGGICPQQAETCKYCKFSFSGSSRFSLNELVSRKSGLRIALIALAILRDRPRTLEGYTRGRRLVAQEYVKDGEFEPAIENLFALPEIDYLQVHSTTADFFTFRIERSAKANDSSR
jgi:hypothetical protein